MRDGSSTAARIGPENGQKMHDNTGNGIRKTWKTS